MKVGIIGCGAISKAHILPLRGIKGVEVVGVCDTDIQRAREIACRYGIPHVYQKVSDMLEERRPDVVHILTPPQNHNESAIQAMEAGCHVLLEKPMAVNVKEADEMIAASQHHGVTLGICHNFLFNPAVIETKELVARGVIGRVIGVEIFWRVYRAKGNRDRYRMTQWIHELPGGIFNEVAPHPVYLQLEFLRTLQVVFAIAKKTGSDLPTPRDELRVIFDGESGLGSMSISVSINPHQVFLNIYGTDATIHVDLLTNTVVKFRRSGSGGNFRKFLVNVDHSVQLLSETVTNTIQTLRGKRRRGHGILIEKFYESLRTGTDPPVTGNDGRAVVAVLDKMWEELNHASPEHRYKE